MSSEKKYKYVLPKGFVLKGGENDYVIDEVLGKGGFGVTYKVRTRVLYRNIKIDAYFAVKEYFPHICSREADNVTIKIPETMQDEVVDGKEDFINEGLKLQEVCKLNPNIVNVNEVFEANGTAYYVLEYLEGGDLRKMVLDNGKPLSEQQMLEIMTPIGHALQCLHDNRMLHLDIKPDNVVMRIDHADGSAEPVLIDFGISAHFNIDGTPTSKTPSQGISPGYSPIEQYDKVDYFDPRIDVYAFCATCFYLLTGKDPIVAMEMTSDYIRNRMPSGISANVVQTLERGMAMSKNARTASIDEVIRGLQNVDKTVKLPQKPEKETQKLGDLSDPKPADSIAPNPLDPNATELASDVKNSGEKDKDVLSKQKRDLKYLIFGLPAVMVVTSWALLSCFKFFNQPLYYISSYFAMLAVSGFVGFIMNKISNSDEYKGYSFVRYSKNLLLGVVIATGVLFIVHIIYNFNNEQIWEYTSYLHFLKWLSLFLAIVVTGCVVFLTTKKFSNIYIKTETLIRLLKVTIIVLGVISVICFFNYFLRL